MTELRDRRPDRSHLDADELVACVVVRAVPAALPDLPRHRAGDRVAARPHRRDAARSSSRARRSTTRSCRDGRVRAVPRLRGGVPVVGAVRPPDGGHARRAPRAAGDVAPRVRRMAEWVALPPACCRATAAASRSPGCAWVAQRLRLVPRRFGLPPLSARSLATPLDAPDGGEPDAWLLHRLRDGRVAARHPPCRRCAVMRAAGARVALPGRGRRLLRRAARARGPRRTRPRGSRARVIASMPGDAPVVVNSAGCGAAMKDYGRLLGTADGAAFSARVRDFSEWLADAGRRRCGRRDRRVVVQDPCHLRHVQQAHGAVRTVLRRRVRRSSRPTTTGCAAAPAARTRRSQPELRGAIRDRKVDALRGRGRRPIPWSRRRTPGACAPARGRARRPPSGRARSRGTRR